jgi:hypothetical protein
VLSCTSEIEALVLGSFPLFSTFFDLREYMGKFLKHGPSKLYI